MRGIAAVPNLAEPRFVDAPEPADPGQGHVLCRTLELGVCGTDREILLSRRPLLPPGQPHLILGHECLARIEAVGPGVSGFSNGDLIVPAVRRAAGQTTSAAARHATPPGRVDLAPAGAYTERGIVHEHGFSTPYWHDRPEHLFKVASELAPWAVLAEPFSVVEKGINEALVIQRARLGDNCWREPPPRVLVAGMGPIGFAALAVSLCRGWPTTLYGRDAEGTFRAELARSFGADYLPAHRAKLSERRSDAEQFDLILECTGSEEVLVEASRSLAACGVMAWLGSSRQPQPLELNVGQMIRDGLLRNHLHVGCVNAAPRDFIDALKHLDQLRRSHPAALASLITARVPPDEALSHYVERQPQGIKTVVDFR